jgi:mannose-1-phosphate guanylyltransferase / mannose-6-phosphate isomerase
MQAKSKYLDKFLINSGATIYEALSKIDLNKKGFLIVSNQDNLTVGVLTDGDIRRALLSSYLLSDNIKEIYIKEYSYLKIKSTFDKTCEKFRLEKNNFLPVLDDDKRIINLITRDQFNVLMLQDFEFDVHYNFSKLDDIPIEHEIYNRPWGFYKTTFISDECQAKIITIFPKGEISLQEHKKREEHWVVIKGEGRVVLGDSIINIYPGKYVFIPKGCKHKVINNSNKNIVFSEIQLGEYFGEDDIIRHQDKYNRV